MQSFNKTLLFLRSSPLFRAFYIPFISEHHTTYRRYVILKPRRQKQPRKRTHGWTPPKYKILATEINHVPSKQLVSMCVCGGGGVLRKCMHVIQSICLIKHLKIRPFKDSLSAFVCVWECVCERHRRGIVCLQVDGRYQLDLFVSVLS